jgi:lipid-A-disaccharide synthase
VARLRAIHTDPELFGCAGPRMRAEGVEAVVAAESLSVVGLVEVLRHIPRIWGEYRKLIRAARQRRPSLAILTDSPDFHLRLARHLKKAGIPVVYLIAPQAWAWREGRVRTMRATIDHLLCIFPFEESFFRDRGVTATYIGHPLARIVRPAMTKTEFFERHEIPLNAKLVAILPGSRAGEIARHIPDLATAVDEMRCVRQDCHFIAGTPAGFANSVDGVTFWERFRRRSINIVEGSTWDLLAHSDVALAASGTVTMEAALCGTPMVTFYRVSPISWLIGRWLVKAPYLSMVNLVAGRGVVAELIQGDMRPERLAAEALRLLEDDAACNEMRAELARVRDLLGSGEHPLDRAVRIIETVLNKETVHAR